MNKKLKIVLIVLAVPVGLILVGAIFLKVYFTSDRLKALVIPRVEEATERKVTVGDISLSIFPHLAVSLEHLTISAPKGVRFSREEFLSLDQLVLDVNILALLNNRLEVNEIILKHPSLYLEVNPDGVANYAPPVTAEKPAAGKKPEAAEQSTGALLLSNFEIINGEVEYVDRKADRRILVKEYDQRMKADVRNGGAEVFFESESSAGGLSYGSQKSFLISNLPLVTFQRLRYDQRTDELSLDSISIGMREITLVLKGTVDHAQARPFLNLSLRSTKADVAQLLSLVPKEYMTKAEGVTSSGKFQFSMTIRGEVGDSVQPDVKGTFTVSDGSVRYAGFPKSITNITLAGMFERPPEIVGKKKTPGNFSIEKFSAMLGTSTMGGKLSVVDFDDPVLTAGFNGELQLGEVKEYYPLEKGTELSGSIRANFSLGGRAKVPSSIKADGTLEFRNVTTRTASSPKPLQNLNGIITFNNQLIDAKKLSMNVGESDLALAFTMRNYLALVSDDASSAGKPSMLATLTSKRLRTADLMSEESPPAEGKKQERGKKAQAALLPNMDVDANVSIDKLETEKFDFTNARGSVKIREGVITLQNFSVNAFQGNIVTRGVLDLRRMERRPFDLNLEVIGVEAHTMLPKFTSFGNNLFGKFSMNTSVKGDLDDTLGLNTKTLNGRGTVQIFDGKLVGYPMTIKLADVTGISELREVQFKDWSNAFTIADGRIHVKDLKIVAANTDFVLNGSQGFDGSLDYKMLVRLPGSVSGRLSIGGLGGEVINFLKDKEGRINLNFKVSGTASDPAYALDTEEAKQKAKQALEEKARQEAERLKQEAMKKAEEELKKKAEEGLKKLFKKP